MTAIEYQEYLQTTHWKQFRKWILKIRGGACEECGISNVWAVFSYGQPLHVHHISYQHLGQERPEDVQVLCRRCHDGQHGVHNLPDMGDVFWKICRAFKEAPDQAWSWIQAIDKLPMCDLKQLSLQFPP